ncbi:MAG: glucosylceramidase [Clostridiales bacterium 43-6]|nr:MAG: glucosylceramidase [Clostridiales bacterium 43-6]
MKGKRFETNQRKGYELKEMADFEFISEDRQQEMQVINVYPEVKYQKMIGFGGAFTEAAGYTLSKMSENNQAKIISSYFGENGIGYTFCRNHINSCDFALGNYAYVEDPADTEFSTFDISRDRQYIIPMIKKAQEVSKETIKFLASPWSPPPFMKTTGKMNNGGKLKDEFKMQWAKYIARYIKEYRKEGIDTFALTVQNEPNAVQVWDSCTYTTEEEMTFVRDYLGPVLEAEGLSDVKIIIWDHNKERVYERARDIFSDAKAKDFIWGVGMHWYTGDHFDAVKITSEVYPDKPIIFTEGCVERGMKVDPIINAEIYAHDMLGNFNNGTAAHIDWNLILDEKGGPNHVENYCAAPIMCETNEDKVNIMLTYYYIGHFSKFIKPGSVRIGTSSYSENLEVSGYQTPEGNRVLVVLNRSEKDLDFHIRENGKLLKQTIDARSMITLVYGE